MSFCRNCGAPLQEDWEFCNMCGDTIDETVSNTDRKIPKKEMSTFKIVVLTVLAVIGFVILKVLIKLLV